MPLEVVNDFTIPDLLRMLNKKLHTECARLREDSLPLSVSIASLQSEVEILATEARDLLRLISSLQNALQPVNRLPPEIISRIVRDSVFVNDAVDTRSIIPSVGVCRYWRNSIVSAPENWTLISSKSKNLTKLSLERSKEAPLQLFLDVIELRKNPGFMDHLAPRIHNVESLEIRNLVTVDDLQQTFPNFPRTMPKLRELDLSLSRTSPDWDSSTDPFEPFPSTLTRLFLYDIPLYPSFLNLRTLTEFTLHNYKFDLPLDTLLTIIEENRSLERVSLSISFTKPSLLDSQRQVSIVNQLRHLSITYYCANAAGALISRIPLPKGANLEIESRDRRTGFGELLSSVSTTHLGNLASPTYMESDGTGIRMSGPNGSFSLICQVTMRIALPGLPPLSFANIRELHLKFPRKLGSVANLRRFHLPSFPALEALAVKYDTNLSSTLSTLLLAPASPPSLKTLAFLDCDLSAGFMKRLTRFASDRKNTASAWLHRVVIVDSSGELPKVALIHTLESHIAVVDVRFGTKLPTDLV